MTDGMRVIKGREAENFMEGSAHCRLYHHDANLWFGVSSVPVGSQAAIDPGHDASKELYFCSRGHALVYDGETYYELEQGDALLIPPGVPHTLFNIGDAPLTVIWAGAPGEVASS